MFSVKLYSCAEFSRMLVESGLEKAWSEQCAAQRKPAIGLERLH